MVLVEVVEHSSSDATGYLLTWRSAAAKKKETFLLCKEAGGKLLAACLTFEATHLFIYKYKDHSLAAAVLDTLAPSPYAGLMSGLALLTSSTLYRSIQHLSHKIRLLPCLLVSILASQSGGNLTPEWWIAEFPKRTKKS
jgi:hypothetical protein